MAKAVITTADGDVVNLDGSPSEIAEVLRKLKIERQGQPPVGKPAANVNVKRTKTRVTLTDLLEELIREQFFKQPKGLGQIKDRLANLGHHYPLTSLSGPLQTIAKARKLRRYKEAGKYLYAQ
jgi:hypothetical protein